MAGKNNALKWVLIGCGGLLVIGLIVVVALTVFVGRKAQEFAAEMEKNPEVMTAKTIAAFNPDIDFVSADEANRTVTFLNNKTGEEITVDMGELKDGKWSIESSTGESMAFDSNDGMTVTTNDGSVRVGEGTGDLNLPAWVLIYPEAGVENSMIQTSQGTISGGFTLALPAGVTADAIHRFYKDHMETNDYKIDESRFDSGGVTTRILFGRHNQNQNQLTVNITEDNGIQAGIQFNGSSE